MTRDPRPSVRFVFYARPRSLESSAVRCIVQPLGTIFIIGCRNRLMKLISHFTFQNRYYVAFTIHNVQTYIYVYVLFSLSISGIRTIDIRINQLCERPITTLDTRTTVHKSTLRCAAVKCSCLLRARHLDLRPPLSENNCIGLNYIF